MAERPPLTRHVLSLDVTNRDQPLVCLNVKSVEQVEAGPRVRDGWRTTATVASFHTIPRAELIRAVEDLLRDLDVSISIDQAFLDGYYTLTDNRPTRPAERLR